MTLEQERNRIGFQHGNSQSIALVPWEDDFKKLYENDPGLNTEAMLAIVPTDTIDVMQAVKVVNQFTYEKLWFTSEHYLFCVMYKEKA